MDSTWIAYFEFFSPLGRQRSTGLPARAVATNQQQKLILKGVITMKTYEIYARPLLVPDALQLVTTLDDVQYQAFKKSVRTSWQYWLREAAHFFYQFVIAFERSIKTFSFLVVFILALSIVFLPEAVTQILEPGLKDLPALVRGFSMLLIMLFVLSFMSEIWVCRLVFTSDIESRYDDAVNELIGLEFDVARWRVVVQPSDGSNHV
jgi:hypothetical protein